jgi:hypothetical protein
VAGLCRAADEAFQRGKKDDIERAYQLYERARAINTIDPSDKARSFLIHHRMARCAFQLCGGSSSGSSSSSSNGRGTSVVSGTGSDSVDAKNCNMLDRAQEHSGESRRFSDTVEDDYGVWVIELCIRIRRAEMESTDGMLHGDTRMKLVVDAEDGEYILLGLLESGHGVDELLEELYEIKVILGCH